MTEYKYVRKAYRHGEEVYVIGDILRDDFEDVGPEIGEIPVTSHLKKFKKGLYILCTREELKEFLGDEVHGCEGFISAYKKLQAEL